MTINPRKSTIFQLCHRSQFYWVGETGIPRENYRPVASHWQIYHIILYRVHLAWGGFEPTKLKVIGTDCIGSYKSSYHTITTTTDPLKWHVFENAINKLRIVQNYISRVLLNIHKLMYNVFYFPFDFKDQCFSISH
jgi:hypothetical protein